MRLQNRKNAIRSTPTARILLLLGILTVLFFTSFLLGRYPVSFFDTVKILAARVLPLERTWTAEMETAVLRIRLPRILLACFIGTCLSSAGTAFQSVFQNPMASPDILGASSGAAFGAALAILLGASSVGITASAFLFGLLTVGIVFLIGQAAPGKRVVNLILAGIMVSSLFSSLTSFLKLVADPSNQLPAITYWLMGSLSGAKLREVLFLLFPMALGLIPLFLLRWRLNLLTLGDDEARSLGVNTDRLRWLTVLCATLLTAAAISVSGMIGWVGLIVPHLCRRLVGNDHRALLPASAVTGAAFLLLVDNVSRCLTASEIPIGILTAFIGAPFFLVLLLKKEAI